MKSSLLLVFAFILTGCVIYPARHVSEPRYEVKIGGGNISRVEITSSLDAGSGTCDGGKILSQLEENKYFSKEEYGWLKAAFMVPVDSYKPIKICVVDESGKKYYWAEDIGVFGNEYPTVWKFNCEISNRKLICEKIT